MKAYKSFLIVISLLIITSCLAQDSNYLKGVWGIKKGENAVFEITADSVYYVDEMKSIKYTATSDSLIFNFDNFFRYRTTYRATADIFGL